MWREFKLKRLLILKDSEYLRIKSLEKRIKFEKEEIIKPVKKRSKALKKAKVYRLDNYEATNIVNVVDTRRWSWRRVVSWDKMIKEYER